MFDAVVNESALRDRRVATGAVVSAGFHAAVLVAAIWIPARALKEEAAKPPIIRIYEGPTRSGSMTQVTSGAGSKPTSHHRTHHRAVVQPTTPLLAPSPAAPSPSTLDPTSAEDPSDESDASDGPSGPPASGLGGRPGEIVGGPGPKTSEPTEWVSGMPAPQLISGRNPEYTSEAREAEVEGSLIAKCVINTAGALEHCRVIKPLPFMSQAVLNALSTRRYQPVIYEGHPIAVDFVFQFRFRLSD